MRAFPVFLLGAVLTSFACGSAWADKLPKDAVELTADEVKAIYSGKTGFYIVSNIYYAPDGTTKGIFGKPKITTTFRGTWSVSGNEICAKNKAKGDPKIYTDCNKFWRSGKKVYDLWTVHYDGSKPDLKGGYATDTLKLFKNGDSVSKKYAASGGE
ncbi:hypothetical protein ACFSOZ_08165 [Mesorhizobium newzealandense]|uniref:DUF995 domain-containing protein n=1 Tax=Mesorhizobium newzealandense TaxID=1300302 RepID=A0ABW4UAE7_9HYPH